MSHRWWALLFLAVAGCGRDKPSASPPGTPPPAAPAPPTPTPAPAPASVVDADTVAAEDSTDHVVSVTPQEIPRQAAAYRGNFIRIWRFYFALAESPTIGFAQVHQESRWKADARSKYAAGLAQFTPETAADFSRLLPAEIRAACPGKSGCPLDPNWALHALSLYDFRLHKMHSWAATNDDRWRLALASYNGGAGWIMKERARAGGSARWQDIVDNCMRAAASCQENREYPVRILEKWRPLYQRWLGL